MATAKSLGAVRIGKPSSKSDSTVGSLDAEESWTETERQALDETIDRVLAQVAAGQTPGDAGGCPDLPDLPRLTPTYLEIHWDAGVASTDSDCLTQLQATATQARPVLPE